VLLRQQELKDAETRLLRATVDQSESEAALSAATAEILDRYGVVLKGNPGAICNHYAAVEALEGQYVRR
jgi:hypothetical protein